MQTISLSQEELATRDGSGKKVLVDGRRGAQRYEYATFQAYDDASLKLSIYTPV